MSYLEHYGLEQEPFSNAPVNRFYFNGRQHSRALLRLMHAVENMRGLAICVGDIGTGKTTLARRMLDSLPEEEYEAALLVIIHSGITASWLLKRIAFQLGVDNPSDEKVGLLSQVAKRLMEIHEEGRKAVVILDEAQMLQSRELMEELRGLLNIELTERKLLSFVFFGLPEIEDNLRLDAPLAQRVALKYRLKPFEAEDSQEYIIHRLRLAGASKTPFSSEALEAIHNHSGGTPRLINHLCDNALFEGYLAGNEVMDRDMIDRVARDLGMHEMTGLEPDTSEGRPKETVNTKGAGETAGKPKADEADLDVDLSDVDRYLDELKSG